MLSGRFNVLIQCERLDCGQLRKRCVHVEAFINHENGHVCLRRLDRAMRMIAEVMQTLAGILPTDGTSNLTKLHYPTWVHGCALSQDW